MPTKLKKTKVYNRRRNNNNNFNPTSYIQPTQAIYRCRLSFPFTIGASGGGNILSMIPVDASGSSEFSSFSSLYDQYRVVAGHLSFCYTEPLITSGSSKENGLLYIAYDWTDTTVPTTSSDVFDTGTRVVYKSITFGDRTMHYNFVYPTSGYSTSIVWSPTSTPTAYGSLKFAATSLTPSVTYLDCLLDLYVQFRGRK
jgi:hypothetical protein